MVDINLIGDDKTQPAGDESSDNFSNTYSADTGELTSDSHLPDSELDQNIYNRSYTKSSSKKTIFTIVGLLVLAVVLVVGWYLTKSPKDTSQFTDQQPIETDTKVEVPEETITTDIPGEVETTAEPVTPVVEVPLSVQQLINSTQNGVRTVETILASMPQNVNLTAITYSDGKFLAEILGRSANDISNLNAQLQQRFSGGNIRLLSQDQKNIGGYTYQQALVNGAISTGGFGNVRPPVYLNADEIKNEFMQNCRDIGLTLKQFDIKNEIRSTDFRKIPVIFRAVGSTDNALNFLNSLVNKNLNVNLWKIVFTPLDRNLNDNRVVLILNMEVYRPI